MTTHNVLILAVLTSILTSCGNHFKFNGEKYRTNSRTDATLGGLGFKNGGFLGLLPETYQPWGRYPLDDVKVRITKPQKIESVSKRKLKAQLEEEGLSGVELTAKVDSTYENINKGRYSLVTFFQEDVLPIVNDTSTERSQARRRTIGLKRARVVTSVIVVYDHNEKTERIFSGDLDVKAESIGNGKVEFSSETGETVSIGDGEVYAYEISYPQYINSEITRLKADRIGFDSRH